MLQQLLAAFVRQQRPFTSLDTKGRVPKSVPVYDEYGCYFRIATTAILVIELIELNPQFILNHTAGL